MKKTIIYATMTGHSKKIALAIADELKIDAYNVKDKPILEKIDTLYIVGGLYGGKSSPQMIEYVNTLKGEHIKRAVLITSSAKKTAKQLDTREMLQSKGINVLEDEFTCQGSFLLIGLRHPNKDDIANAVEFAKGI